MKNASPQRVAWAALAGFVVIYLAFGLNGWGTPAENEQPIGEVSRWCERVEDGLLRAEHVRSLQQPERVVNVLRPRGRDGQ